jgi:hypothetical protein
MLYWALLVNSFQWSTDRDEFICECVRRIRQTIGQIDAKGDNVGDELIYLSREMVFGNVCLSYVNADKPLDTTMEQFREDNGKYPDMIVLNPHCLLNVVCHADKLPDIVIKLTDAEFVGGKKTRSGMVSFFDMTGDKPLQSAFDYMDNSHGTIPDIIVLNPDCLKHIVLDRDDRLPCTLVPFIDTRDSPYVTRSKAVLEDPFVKFGFESSSPIILPKKKSLKIVEARKDVDVRADLYKRFHDANSRIRDLLFNNSDTAKALLPGFVNDLKAIVDELTPLEGWGDEGDESGKEDYADNKEANGKRGNKKRKL